MRDPLYRLLTISFLLLVIVGVGIAFRLKEFSGYPLGQDEAETAINAIQIMEVGYPYGEYKGLPLYENASFIPSTSLKYEFESTNYYGSPFEKNKGWLPYYLVGLSFKMFGVSAWSARLPFLALSGFTVILLFLFGVVLFRSQSIGIVAGLLFALDPIAIHFGGQARYYALLALLYLMAVLTTAWYMRKKSWPAALTMVLTFVLLFHTHIPATLTALVAFVYLHIRSWGLRSIVNARSIIMALLFLLFTMPWVILVRFWMVLVTHQSFVYVKWLWIGGMLAIGLALLVALRAFPGFAERIKKEWSGAVRAPLVFLGAYVILVPLILPLESVGIRPFSGLLPLLSLLGGIVTVGIVQAFKNARMHMAPLSLLLMFSALYSILVPFYFSRLFLAQAVEDARWVAPAVQVLNQKNVPVDTWIVVNTMDHTFRLESAYTVEKMWTVRKSWFDRYPHRFIAIINANLYRAWCLPNYRDRERCDDPASFPFWDRISRCPREEVQDGIYLFDCPAKINASKEAL